MADLADARTVSPEDVATGDGSTRQLSAWMLFGMLMLPYLFVWLFLRRGYRTSLRKTAFIYVFVQGLFGVIAVFAR
jgi:hypothetical protein